MRRFLKSLGSLKNPSLNGLIIINCIFIAVQFAQISELKKEQRHQKMMMSITVEIAEKNVSILTELIEKIEKLDGK